MIARCNSLRSGPKIMAIRSVDTVVLLFPNEEWIDTASDAQLATVVSQLQPTISFTQHLGKDDLQTLSTHHVDGTGEIDGFLYVPDLDRTDACFNTSKQYVPANVTRQANLPDTDFTLIALAPWISVECTEAYLSAASSDPTRAFLFYLPNNGTGQPPSVSSPSWTLHDGGSWKENTPYPVYAVSSSSGTELMHQLSLYSGNMTRVPFGHDISEIMGVDPRDYVRMFAQLDVSNGTVFPSFWVFILAIAGTLSAFLAIVSGSMHLIQRSRRTSLRRRVANGEVNLEALGIKRLTVPQEVIDKLPIFIYTSEGRRPSPSSTRNMKNPLTTTVERHGSTSSNTKDIHEETATDLDSSTSPSHFLPYSQSTCAICLDDFESGTTPIKELPCGHIFHPECIDAFLGEHSSLCPMCKKTVLPIGYVPTRITNSMVRRERNLRALRTRVTVHDHDTGEDGRGPSRNISSILRDIIHPSTSSREVVSVPLEPQLVVMTSAVPPEANPHASVLGHEVLENLSPGLTREEIAQRRIRELTSRQTFAEEVETVNTSQRPKWRRTLAKAFPGFT